MPNFEPYGAPTGQPFQGDADYRVRRMAVDPPSTAQLMARPTPNANPAGAAYHAINHVTDFNALARRQGQQYLAAHPVEPNAYETHVLGGNPTGRAYLASQQPHIDPAQAAAWKPPGAGQRIGVKNPPNITSPIGYKVQPAPPRAPTTPDAPLNIGGTVGAINAQTHVPGEFKRINRPERPIADLFPAQGPGAEVPLSAGAGGPTATRAVAQPPQRIGVRNAPRLTGPIGYKVPAGGPPQTLAEQAQHPAFNDAFARSVYQSKLGFGYTPPQAQAEAINAYNQRADESSRLANQTAQVQVERDRLGLDREKMADMARLPLMDKLTLQYMHAGATYEEARARAVQSTPPEQAGAVNGPPPPPGAARPQVNANNAADVLARNPAVQGLFPPLGAAPTMEPGELAAKLRDAALPGYNDPSSPLGQALRSKMLQTYGSQKLDAMEPDPTVIGPGRQAPAWVRTITNMATLGQNGNFNPFSDPIAHADEAQGGADLWAALSGRPAPPRTVIPEGGIGNPMTALNPFGPEGFVGAGAKDILARLLSGGVPEPDQDPRAANPYGQGYRPPM